MMMDRGIIPEVKIRKKMYGVVPGFGRCTCMVLSG